MKMSQRILDIKPSATFAVDAQARELAKQGKDVISFGAGEPDFISPPIAFEYAKEAMEKGYTHYTPTPGIIELRKEICTYYKQNFGVEYEPNQVVVGSGAKPCIYEALAAIIDPGDEVIVLAPTWVSYIEQIKLMDGKVVVVETQTNNFILDLEELKSVITDRTVAIIINSPANPTGIMLDEQTIKGIGQICIDHDLWLIWDEIYERIVSEQAIHYNPVQLLQELKSRTIIINGVSKSYAMTGWRIGYLIAPEKTASRISAFQSHMNSNPTSIAQWAALGVLRHSEKDVLRMKEIFSQRREFICKLLSDMPLVSFPRPDGTLYVFVNIEQCIGKRYEGKLIEDDLSFCSLLLDAELVAVVPGSAFLAPGYLRFSYACSFEVIEEGMKRLKRFLQKIK